MYGGCGAASGTARPACARTSPPLVVQLLTSATPSTTQVMPTIKQVARAVACRWGQLDEEPPETIEQIMSELTAALQEAEEAGNKTRAGCLDRAIRILAHGVADQKSQANERGHTPTFERALAKIRRHNRRGQGGPRASATGDSTPRESASGDVASRGQRTGRNRGLHVASCQRPT